MTRYRRALSSSARSLFIVACAVGIVACTAGASRGRRPTGQSSTLANPSTSVAFTTRPPLSVPHGDTGDGGPPDGAEDAPVTVPAGLTDGASVVAALEAQRGDRPIALYWRELLLHAAAADAYLYINDLARTDLDAGLRERTAERALAALRLTEVWHPGDARPELANFESVAEELTTRLTGAAGVDVLATNAARSIEGPGLVDVLIVYRPTYADGSSDRTDRLVVVLDPTFAITNAYYF